MSILQVSANKYYHLSWAPIIFLFPIWDDIIATSMRDYYCYVLFIPSFILPDAVRNSFIPLFVSMLVMFYNPYTGSWKSDSNTGCCSDELFNLLYILYQTADWLG